MKKTALLCFTLLAAACSGDSPDRYVGLWKLEEGRRPSVLEISKEDGKAYRMNDDILKETDFFGRKKTGHVMVVDDKGGLGFNNGFAVVPFVLSEDGKKLYVDGSTYTKMKESEFPAFKEEAEKSQAACRALHKEYGKEQQAVLWGGLKDKEKEARLAALKKSYQEKQSKIAYCKGGI